MKGVMADHKDAVLAKYREERQKRLRSDGIAQYVEMSGDLARYKTDPYVPRTERVPLTDEVDVVIIGGGLGGLLAGARLRQAGVKRIRIVERGGDFGGTWYWNRYPGAACDVEGYVYIPMLAELGTIPSRRYARGAEIREHCRLIAKKFDLYRDACLQTQVMEARWDESLGRWRIKTDRGDDIRTIFVVACQGLLDVPKLPGIPGIESFKGHAFHTSRWDYGYTGGDANGSLDGLRDKVVGVIGTGATAIQCVPHLAASAKHLYVFQRTPSSVDARNDSMTDPQWVASLEAGWQTKRVNSFTRVLSGVEGEEDLVSDGWTDLNRIAAALAREKLAAGEPLNPEELGQSANFIKMEQIRERVSSIVRDRKTAEALKPYYNFFCKRPCFSDEYLQSFNRPNVTLVDTEGRGVERLTEHGVMVGGREYPVDCLVYATGFAPIYGDRLKKVGFETYGRGGQPLSEHWRDGARTLHGIHSHGFPNYFMIQIAQSGFSFNFTHMLDEQTQHIAHIVERAYAAGADIVEATERAEEDWFDEMRRSPFALFVFLAECTPSYYNNEGAADSINIIRNGPYGGGGVKYLEVLEAWRKQDHLQGLTLTRAKAGPEISA
jgi:cyclohexanone monooxygenase